MAYGTPYNGYPGGYYTPQFQAMPMQQQFSPAQPPQQPQTGGINWVQGESGAKAFAVAPGQSAMLMDSEDRRFYIKTVDATGMPSLRTFDFQERTVKPKDQQPNADYVTRDEFTALCRAVEAMKGGLTNAEPVTRSARGSKQATQAD